MATITENKNKNGISYKVSIRNKNVEISKTFYTREDAELYAFYKERLITNMENFEVNIKDTVTLEQIYELKLKDLEGSARKTVNDTILSLNRFEEFFKDKVFYKDITLEDWKDAANYFLNTHVFCRGGKHGKKITASPITIRNMFSYASAAVSFAISQGIDIPNNPMIVIQSYINPKIKGGD